MTQNWIKHPMILRGQEIRLIPLEKDHLEELYLAASDRELWQLVPTDCSDKKKFETAYNFALTEREKGNQYPFVIFHNQTKKIIGSTRLFDIYPTDKKIEIGWTWIIKNYWGTTVNLECKLLLLTFCFEILKTVRVQLKTRDTNIRSRKAIEKIGAKFEGILRKDKIQDNGTTRNAAYFSIIDEEWVDAKKIIISKIEEKKASC
ncbi:MAG: GNAT family N-acetyltransferase [Bacteroidia bacterium]